MSPERFIEAQAGNWPAPLEEIRAGQNRTHWMWFIWPQLRGLGRSPTAVRYGLIRLEEAKAFLADGVLGPRLIEISEAMLTHEGKAPETILGPVDAMKLCSCATLFHAAGGGAVFGRLLDAFNEGRPCAATLEMMKDAPC